MRDAIPASEVSFVTNGINVPKYVDRLKEVKPSKVCISVDDVGVSDSIRGVKNVTHKAIKALNEAGIPVEVFIDLHKGNYTHIYSILDFLSSNYDIGSFLIRNIIPIGCAVNIPRFSSKTLNFIYGEVKKFFDTHTNSKGVLCINIEDVTDLINSGLEKSSIVKGLYKVTDSGSFSITDNFSFFPKMYCSRFEHQITITSDGYVQGCASESCFEDYRRASMGSVRELPLKELIEKGKEDSLSYLSKGIFSCFCSNPLDFT